MKIINNYKRWGLTLCTYLVLSLWIIQIGYCQNSKHGALVDSVTIHLWKGTPPFHKNLPPEKRMRSRGDGVIRITDVSNPTMTVYHPQKINPDHTAIIICPGGGYSHLAYNLEGTDIAHWLGSKGIIPIVLKYRVPNQKKGAFADVQRAITILRSQHRNWDINPDKIGVIGFSAGGDLVAWIITHYKKRIYPTENGMNNVSIKPDFGILIYPAYLVNKEDMLENDVKIQDPPPPAFLIQTQDDPVGYRNSLFFFNALTKHHVQAEISMFSHGGHGYGLTTPKSNPLSNWPNLCVRWLKSIKMIQ
ncbi:MAG TPA: alpha/beta hydrolase [Balneolales bacterium]|nr:alpha/beta hydrolase [Balneolales bacterium]